MERHAQAGEGTVKFERAWVRLQSGKRLDLLNPQSDSGADRDLAIGLAWTHGWGGQSRWDQPLSVAQHSLLVLTIRQQMQPHQSLTRGEALRELLHDGLEGFLGFDAISPVKPHLGQDFPDVANRLQLVIAARYDLPPWSGEPWPTKLVASVFLCKLRELANSEWTPDQPASLDAALARCRELKALAVASARLPEQQQRKYLAPKGGLFTEIWVSATADSGIEMDEGIVVWSERDEEGEWLLDQPFTIFTPDEQLTRCMGYNCHVVVE